MSDIDLLTDEGKKALIEKVWDQNQEQIKKEVAYTITSEIRAGMGSKTRHVLATKMDKLLEEVVAEKRDEILAAVKKHGEKLIARATERFELDFREAARTAFSDATFKPMEELGQKIYAVMARAVDEALNESEDARRQMRERARSGSPGQCPRCRRQYRFEEEVKMGLCAVCVKEVFDSGLVKETVVPEKKETPK